MPCNLQVKSINRSYSIIDSVSISVFTHLNGHSATSLIFNASQETVQEGGRLHGGGCLGLGFGLSSLLGSQRRVSACLLILRWHIMIIRNWRSFYVSFVVSSTYMCMQQISQLLFHLFSIHVTCHIHRYLAVEASKTLVNSLMTSRLDCSNSLLQFTTSLLWVSD